MSQGANFGESVRDLASVQITDGHVDKIAFEAHSCELRVSHTTLVCSTVEGPVGEQRGFAAQPRTPTANARSTNQLQGGP